MAGPTETFSAFAMELPPEAAEASKQHVLTDQLSSLRNALRHYQDAAHGSALQLQRQTMETELALQRVKELESLNSKMQKEVSLLRGLPDSTPHPATLATSELTIAHRKLSERLTYAEETLLERTKEFTHVSAKLASTTTQSRMSKQLVERARRREEEAKERSRLLENTLRSMVEEKKMAERAVQEYADLVLEMEGRSRKSAGSSISPSSDQTRVSNPSVEYQTSKRGLQRILEDFNSKTSTLENEVSRLLTELETTNASLEVERKRSLEDRERASYIQAELDAHKGNDRAATKLVSRYMKFSQSSIDLLQTALDTQRTRHEATLHTLHAEKAQLSQSLLTAQSQTTRLGEAVDELVEDTSRESFGRRREVALRLRMISREEAAAEQLRALVRRLNEGLGRMQQARVDNDEKHSDSVGPLELACQRALNDASLLLRALDGSDTPEVSLETSKPNWRSGSLARVIASQDAVNSLVDELQQETERRLKLELKLRDYVMQEPTIHSGFTKPNVTTEDKSTETLVEPDAAIRSTPPLIEVVPSSAPTPKVVVVNVLPDTSVAGELAQPEPSEQGQITAEETVEPLVHPTSPQIVEIMVDVPAPPEPEPAFRSLMIKLAEASTRYDSISKSFKDCHLTLTQLKASILALDQPAVPSQQKLPQPEAGGIAVLRSFLDRLDDYSEDCRVELEIRIADEIRIAKGYETLLSVPGAVEVGKEAEVLEDSVLTFVEGRDPSIARAQEAFRRKLGDLEHDIAMLKRFIHENGLTEPGGGDLRTLVPSTSSNPLVPGWSWTPSLLSSRPVSPASTYSSLFGGQQSQEDLSSPNQPPSQEAGTPSQPGSLFDLPFRIAMPTPPPAGPTAHTSVVPSLPRVSGAFRPRIPSSTSLSTGLNMPLHGLTKRPSFMERPRSVSSSLYNVGLSPRTHSQQQIPKRPDIRVINATETESEIALEDDILNSDVE